MFLKFSLLGLASVSLMAQDFAQVQAVGANDSQEVRVAKAAHVIPSPRQFAYLQREFIGFIHFGPNTFSGREWGNGQEDPASFAPKQVDTDDWCAHMKAAGITCVVMTFKHHDGYVLWQSRYEPHQSIRNSPYQNGKGDIAKQLAASCKKYGLKFGIYLSPADLYQIESKEGLYGNQSAYRDSVIPTDPASFKSDPMKPRKDVPKGSPTFQFSCDDYNRLMLNQLYEMLTEYGPVDEVWFDGATPKSKGGQKYTYAAWYEVIRKLAPQAVIFGKGPDVRWCGNEAGGTRDTEWNVIPLPVAPEQFDWPDLTAKDLGSREKLKSANYLYYLPCETNTSIRHGWFWRNDDEQTVRGADDVFDIYERSVGGNSVFMLNVPPNQDGKFSPRDVTCLHEVGRRIRETYGKDLLKGAKASAVQVHDGKPETFWQPSGETGELTLQLPAPVRVNRFTLQEAIDQQGQRIEGHALDAWIGGAWKEIAVATTVGYKRILRFETVTTDRLRLRVTASRLSPTISEVSAHFYAQPPLPVSVRTERDGKVELSLMQPKFTGKGAGFKLAGAEIRYTLDGKEPGRESLLYREPISLPGGGRIKARSFTPDGESEVVSVEIGLPTQGWKVTTDSEQDAAYGAQKAIDGDPNTFWHTRWSEPVVEHPHWIQLDLGAEHEVAAITYLPRQDKRVPDSMIEAGKVEVSVDGKQWVSGGEFVFGNLLNEPSMRTFRLKQAIRGRYVRVTSTAGAQGKPYAGAAEIGVIPASR